MISTRSLSSPPPLIIRGHEAPHHHHHHHRLRHPLIIRGHEAPHHHHHHHRLLHPLIIQGHEAPHHHHHHHLLHPLGFQPLPHGRQLSIDPFTATSLKMNMTNKNAKIEILKPFFLFSFFALARERVFTKVTVLKVDLLLGTGK